MLSEQVASSVGIPHRRADRIIVCTLDTIARRLFEREPVKLEDFGKFEVMLQKGWNGHHPASGELTRIPERASVRFRPGRKLRRRLERLPAGPVQ